MTFQLSEYKNTHLVQQKVILKGEKQKHLPGINSRFICCCYTLYKY